MSICPLPADESVLIHAGVVIQTPISIVKELVENSIDAGATLVTVRVSMDLSAITVEDNGEGIDKEQVGNIQFGRTSKVGTFYYGYRGQALSSIAAQAGEVHLITKSRRTHESTAVCLHTGNNLTNRTAQRVGTTIIVKHPFQKIPVRNSFWSDKGRIIRQLNEITRYCIGMNAISPQLHLTLVKGSKASVSAGSKPVKTVPESVKVTFGNKVFNGLDHMNASTPTRDQRGSITVDLFLSKIGSAGNSALRSKDDRIYTCINGRLVRWRAGVAAVRGSWLLRKSPSTANKEPIMILLVTLPHWEVDLNVCPQKSEVFFPREKDILDVVATALSRQPNLPIDNGWQSEPTREASPAPDLFLTAPGGISAFGSSVQPDGGNVDPGGDSPEEDTPNPDINLPEVLSDISSDGNTPPRSLPDGDGVEPQEDESFDVTDEEQNSAETDHPVPQSPSPSPGVDPTGGSPGDAAGHGNGTKSSTSSKFEDTAEQQPPFKGVDPVRPVPVADAIVAKVAVSDPFKKQSVIGSDGEVEKEADSNLVDDVFVNNPTDVVGPNTTNPIGVDVSQRSQSPTSSPLNQQSDRCGESISEEQQLPTGSSFVVAVPPSHQTGSKATKASKEHQPSSDTSPDDKETGSLKDESKPPTKPPPSTLFESSRHQAKTKQPFPNEPLKRLKATEKPASQKDVLGMFRVNDSPRVEVGTIADVKDKDNNNDKESSKDKSESPGSPSSEEDNNDLPVAVLSEDDDVTYVSPPTASQDVSKVKRSRDDQSIFDSQLNKRGNLRIPECDTPGDFIHRLCQPGSIRDYVYSSLRTARRSAFDADSVRIKRVKIRTLKNMRVLNTIGSSDLAYLCCEKGNVVAVDIKKLFEATSISELTSTYRVQPHKLTQPVLLSLVEGLSSDDANALFDRYSHDENKIKSDGFCLSTIRSQRFVTHAPAGGDLAPLKELSRSSGRLKSSTLQILKISKSRLSETFPSGTVTIANSAHTLTYALLHAAEDSVAVVALI
eukprot:TRINITY_DN4326_c0_g1_i8.p1 TRINITY_DN4326_c0_g1~~TRINITY_DN4326_c0_g1_i8.p1  ORF type:complete len:1003 (+),score=214.05 TRINITY_DN4326_c0_g1_i8:97-3105(+)